MSMVFKEKEIPECKFSMTEGGICPDRFTYDRHFPPKFSTFNYSFLLTGAIVCVKKKTGA